ncbi:MAG: molybdopterin converting factor subunit 1 [Cellvibrionaceae bacterium]|nr:molybdopterin converting factor subunit 1 [Cellvibrionaceae bacterium]
MARIKILYFASIAEAVGSASELLNIPDHIATVKSLKSHLASRGSPWASCFSESSTKCAVNQVLATPDSSIKDGDEVAFFPPVTGG